MGIEQKTKRNIIIKKKEYIRPLLIVLFISLVFLNKLTCLEQAEDTKSKFSLKLAAGWSYIAIGDINRCLESFNNNQLFEGVRNNSAELITGEITKLNNNLRDLEVELRMDIGSKISLSFVTSGPIIKKDESSLTYIYRGEAGDQISQFTFKPDIWAWMPIKLGICYSIFYSSRINLIFNVGVGYHIAKVSQHRKMEQILPLGGIYSETCFWKACTIEGSSFQSGIEVEYNLKKDLAFIIEIQGRYANLRDLKGTMKIERNWGGDYIFNSDQKGTLYYFNMWDDAIGAPYANLEVWEKAPEADFRWINNVKKAVLDLSELSLRMGIRIKLF